MLHRLPRGIVQGDHAIWRYGFLGGMVLGALAVRGYMPGAFDVLPDTFTVGNILTFSACMLVVGLLVS